MQTLAQRDPTYDNARFALILLVVVGHALQRCESSPFSRVLLLAIYSFHIPCFALMSGFFSKSKNRHVLGLVLTYTFAQFLTWIVPALVSGNIKVSSFRFFTPNYALWYLLSLCVWRAILIAIDKIGIGRIPAVAFSLVIALASGLLPLFDSDYRTTSRIVTFFPFFLTGFFCDADLLNKLTKKRRFILTALSIASLGIAVCLVFACIKDCSFPFIRNTFMGIVSGATSYATMKLTPLYGSILRGVWYLTSISLSLLFLAMTPEKIFFFTRLGSRTLQIYILHSLVFITAAHQIQFICTRFGIIGALLFACGLTFLLSNRLLSPFFDFLYRFPENRAMPAPATSK